MSAAGRRRRRGLALGVPLFLAAGCNAIIGADAPSERDEVTSLDGGTRDASVDQTSPAVGTPDAVAEATPDAFVEAAADAFPGDESAAFEAAADAPPPDAPSESGCGDTSTDPKNCGACGHDCTALQHVVGAVTCGAEGQCVFPLSACAPGWTHCSGNADQGCETDISTDANCGGCGMACTAGAPVCSGSAGTYACTTGCSGATSTLCATTGTCVNVTTDPGNCGSCGNACPGVAHGQPGCTSGGCAVLCNSGYTNCSGACVDLTSDNGNCSACGKTCTGGADCTASACQCTGGTHSCGGVCVANDSNACGASCVSCASSAPSGGTSSCNGTTCVPSCTVSTDVICGSACVDETVNGNCGACGTTCSGTTPICAGRACVECTTGTQCAPGGNTPQTCIGDTWVSQTPCAAPDPVCANGSCVECTSGTQCDSTSTWIQSCVNDVWTDQTMCTPDQVCRAAACVTALEDVGNASALSGSFSLFAGILYVFRLPPLAHAATLLTFGTFGNAAGANAKLVLYGDDGAGTGPAGAAISSVAASLALIDGQREQSASSNATLTQGATYWLGIVVDANTTIAAQADAASVGTKLSVAFGAVPPWPAGSSGVAVTPASDLAIYISLQDLN